MTLFIRPMISIITACKSSESESNIYQLVQSVKSQDPKIIEKTEWVWVINGPNSEVISNIIRQNIGSFLRFQIEERSDRLTPGLARSIAINLAKGEYICIQDSDDYMLPNRLQTQCNQLLSSGADVVFSKLVHFERDQDLKDILQKQKASLNAELVKVTPFNLSLHCVPRNPSAFIRRSVFENSSYHPLLSVSEDYWLWCSIVLNNGKIFSSSTPLVAYRIDSNFYIRRRGYRHFKNDVYVKTYFLTNQFRLARVLALTIAYLTSFHRLLGTRFFSILYRLSHNR